MLVVINLQNKEIDAANEGILNQNPIQALAAAIPTAVNMTLENPHASKNNDTDPCLLRRWYDRLIDNKCPDIFVVKKCFWF